jgi:hypothetical protein
VAFQSFDQLQLSLTGRLNDLQKQLRDLTSEPSRLEPKLASARDDISSAKAFYDESVKACWTARRLLNNATEELKAIEEHRDENPLIQKVSTDKRSRSRRRSDAWKSRAGRKRELEDAVKTCSDAKRQMNKAERSLKAIQERKDDIPRVKAETQKELEKVSTRITRLGNRASRIRSSFYSDEWRALFSWDSVLDLDEDVFECLVGDVEVLADVAARWHEADMTHKSLAIDASEVNTEMRFEKLAEADHMATEMKARLEAARTRLLQVHIAGLRKQMAILPKLPPTANEELHDITLSRQLSIRKEIERHQETLEEIWPKSPDQLYGLFYN